MSCVKEGIGHCITEKEDIIALSLMRTHSKEKL